MELQILKKINILGKYLEIYGNKEKPLFLAKDIAEWINHTDVSKMCLNLEENTEKLIRTIFVAGQKREVVLLTEYGVYEILFTSRKKVAKEIRTSLKAFLRAWRKQDVKVIDNNPNEVKNILVATKNLLEVSSQHEERINDLENKVENSIIIETYQKGVVQKAIGKRVHVRFKELGEKVEKKDLYHNIHRELKYKFNVRSYGDLKKKDYEIALEWIENWLENSDLRW